MVFPWRKLKKYQVILMVGLPGSGKSTLAKRLSQRFKAQSRKE
jgi:signal recognition particle GTPase